MPFNVKEKVRETISRYFFPEIKNTLTPQEEKGFRILIVLFLTIFVCLAILLVGWKFFELLRPIQIQIKENDQKEVTFDVLEWQDFIVDEKISKLEAEPLESKKDSKNLKTSTTLDQKSSKVFNPKNLPCKSEEKFQLEPKMTNQTKVQETSMPIFVEAIQETSKNLKHENKPKNEKILKACKRNPFRSLGVKFFQISKAKSKKKTSIEFHETKEVTGSVAKIMESPKEFLANSSLKDSLSVILGAVHQFIKFRKTNKEFQVKSTPTLIKESKMNANEINQVRRAFRCGLIYEYEKLDPPSKDHPEVFLKRINFLEKFKKEEQCE
jgi:hypothetical protein